MISVLVSLRVHGPLKMSGNQKAKVTYRMEIFQVHELEAHSMMTVLAPYRVHGQLVMSGS